MVNITQYPIKTQVSFIKDLPDFKSKWYYSNDFNDFSNWLNSILNVSKEAIEILKTKFEQTQRN